MAGFGNATMTNSVAHDSTAFRSRFASLSLHMTDRIRLLEFPPEVIPLIRKAIAQSWPNGVQTEQLYGGSHEFKLKGRPWSGKGDEAVHARRLIKAILFTLFDIGWILALSTDVSRKVLDKDTLIFRHQDPAPLSCEWCVIAFSRQDRLRLIDAPTSLVDNVARTIAQVSRPGGARPHDSVKGTYEITLVQSLWRASGEDTVVARRVLLQLMGVLEEHGFTVYGSIDQKQGSDNVSETDTWYCSRPAGWQKGAPVYHA